LGYLIFQILFFLLIAAVLGFVVGWLLRGSRFQSELKDLDARWRSKLGEIEGDRDRFAGEVNLANESKAKAEASAAEAQRLAETNDSSLQQLRREHQTKLGLLSSTEQRAGGLEKELAEAKASLAKQQSAGGDAGRLGKELAAASTRTADLERDLRSAKEANGACKREVERLEARVAELQRAGGSSALAQSGPSGAVGSGSGSAGGGSGGRLGLVGGTEGSSAGGSGSSGGQNEPGFRQKAAAPSGLAESGSQGIQTSGGSGSSQGSEENEGVRPEALSGPRGGSADDLKKISGVGPKLEKTLNGLGIFHFSQIAAFTPDHVAWVDQNLRFKGRIEREKWIEQAKVLATGGETEFSRRN